MWNNFICNYSGAKGVLCPVNARISYTVECNVIYVHVLIYIYFFFFFLLVSQPRKELVYNIFT